MESGRTHPVTGEQTREPASEDVRAQVRALRRFNRYFTRRIGVLDDHYLGQDRPLGEARLLFEIGDGVSLRELRSRLGLDAGYLSRMTKALQSQGMVRVRVHPADSRLRSCVWCDLTLDDSCSR